MSNPVLSKSQVSQSSHSSIREMEITLKCELLVRLLSESFLLMTQMFSLGFVHLMFFPLHSTS